MNDPAPRGPMPTTQSGPSLTREFALWSAGLAMVAVLATGTLAYVVARNHLHTDIAAQLRAEQHRLGERLDDAIVRVSGNVASLARTPLFAEALVDADLRKAHLESFLERVRVAGDLAVALILVDAEGRALTGGRSATNGALLTTGGMANPGESDAPRTRVHGADPARLEIIQPVVSPGADGPRGALVARVELAALLGERVGALAASDFAALRSGEESLAHRGAPAPIPERFLTAAAPLVTLPDLTLVLGRERSAALAPLGELTAMSVVGGSIAVLVVFLVASWIARRITRPIVELAAQARATTSADTLQGMHIDVRADNEIGALAGALDAMLRRVQDLHRDLEQRVAQRTQALGALRESEGRFRGFLENAPAAIFLKDRDSRYTLVNRRFEEWYGHSAQETLGRCAHDFFPRAEADTYREMDREVIASGVPLTGEARLTTRSGARLWIAITKFPVRDARGQVIGVGTINLDISARKRGEAELRRLNEGLEQRVRERTAELLAANRELEAFSYTASHDLRAPLRALDGFSQALLEDCGERLDEQARTYLGFIQKGSRDMSRMLDGLLQLARSTRGELHREEVDVSELAAAVVCRLREEHGGRAVSTEIPADLSVAGDPRLLRVAFANLLHNAWKYTQHRTHATIRLSGYTEGAYDVIAIEDNGAGFDPAFADKLFQPFQRLHGEHEFEGTGIGLATVARIVERHGGRIEAEGSPGRGARFAIALPRAGREHGERGPPAALGDTA